MTGTITWEQIISLMGLITLFGGVWFKVQQSISAVATKLTDFELHVATNYVRDTGMKDVEQRLTDQIKALTDEIAGWRKEMMASRRRT
jgi:hypothetical protein